MARGGRDRRVRAHDGVEPVSSAFLSAILTCETGRRHRHLSFRAKRGISPSTAKHFNYEILHFVQDDDY